ncbi:TspO/MBR family protein [Sphingomonas sp. RT2P30]
MGRAWLFPMVIAGAGAILVAALGMTITEVGPWYHHLIEPRWAPPEAMFGVAWTIIFALTAIAGVTGWRAMPTPRARDLLIGLFALNGFLNILWSLIFFRLHRPDWALVELLILWLSVLALVLVTWRHSIVGAVLLLPYLGWVTFAGYLDMTIVRLNGPFP